ncbi:hypothetical protein PgNI_11118 [Pyricularia grisea]|uniref:Pyrroline-5-carboxylate reductase catalytic N-terminal domain-containing protein n=1 Tax=Pyricularia grisea TaxID=148305 RepID=A0A6P8AXY7_PYRGI|nr:hypothetical protein PgNI_11118 [Pyricularia grisea]TLD07154.1 hypothetical protein PgNI_11118 [Pyricularia grisea]
MQGPDEDHTVAIIGCGRLGTAVMKGMLKTIESVNSNLLKLQNESRHFILCVKSQESADRLRKEFAKYTGTNSKATNVPRCSIYRGRNVAAAQQAEPVIFGCQPQQLSRILSEDGMASALRNKLSISICAGFSGNAIRGMLGVDDESLYPVVHAMPNVCSTVGQSTTVITETVLGARHFALATWTFAGDWCCKDLWRVQCGVDWMRTKLWLWPLKQWKGTAHMVLDLAEDPAALTARVSTPGGCTDQGVGVLQAMAVTNALEKAIVEAVARALELAKQ